MGSPVEIENKPEKSMPVLQLKKNEERRLRAGHLWVFSNEVDTKASPLNGFKPGQLVEIVNSRGKSLGNGYVNPKSLICARLISRNPRRSLSMSLLIDRLKLALSLRERIYQKPFYRLVYGESDGLPGLIVDRYEDILVVQISTAGMECMKLDIVTALEKVIAPSAIVLRNDSAIRELEGLDRYVETVFGEVPDKIQLEENGCQFEVSLTGGQKTGWFYDHRENRSKLGKYVKGKRVLDVFSYVGGWGIQAAVAGASEVLCVDSSQAALEQLEKNAMLNQVVGTVSTQQGDSFDVLKDLRNAQEKFDVVVLDPPAFIKRRKDAKKGLEAYRRLNDLAMKVLEKDGILVSASCSYHLQRNDLQNLLLKITRSQSMGLSILEQGYQGPDHPMHPAIPETVYLKAIFARVLSA
jgi:23S rRNA (cytosine1962-C5)-methyltransferase